MDQDVKEGKVWVGDSGWGTRPWLLTWLWPITIVVCLSTSIFSAVLAQKIIDGTQNPASISVSYPYGTLDLPEITPSTAPKITTKTTPSKKKSTKTKKPTSAPPQADKTE